ncbi:MAG: ATP-binding protein [Anaerolineae bacterium]|jgi:signal transduction histidine kinase/CheY-like chemotaxis protein
MQDRLIHALLIEDNPGDARLIREMLVEARATDFVLVTAGRLSSGLDYLDAQEFDVVLLDLSLPGFRGLETFDRLYQHTSRVPVVVLTGLDDEGLATEAVRAGAQDYLIKGQVDSPLLIRALRYAIERHRAEQERERLLAAERQQRRVSETLMEVTGLLNTTLDQGHVLQLILEQLARIVDYDSASVMQIFDGNLAIAAQRGFPTADQAFTPLPTIDLPHVLEVVESAAPLIIPDTHQDPRWMRRADSSYIRSWLGVPLLVQGRVIGLLNLDKKSPGYYAEHHAAVAVAFANQAAIAMENARLYQDLQDRIAELHRAQAQLIESERLAAIGRLSAGIAHELNNPLQAVLGFSELLLRNPGMGDRSLQELEIIVQESRRARDIVRRLLEFARQVDTACEPTDINRLLQDTLELLRSHLRSQEILLVEDYDAHLPAIAVDAGRIKQVFLNLVGNAMQAMPSGGQLTISTGCVKEHIVVRVADTGPGISAGDLPHIFEPFFTTKPVGQGTGLGLSVSLGIVRDHGGEIRVESDQGTGTTFEVLLPLALEHELVAGGI